MKNTNNLRDDSKCLRIKDWIHGQCLSLRSKHTTTLIFLQFIFFITGCTARDIDLENALSAKLQQFKNSDAPSMDLNDVLGKNWRKVCLQGPYTIEEDFNKDSGENVNLLDISENENAIWVFYNDGSVRAAVLKRSSFDFGAYTSKNGHQNLCASIKNPHLYISVLRDAYFYFKY